MEDHYYNAKHSKLAELGLKPHLLTDNMLDSMLGVVCECRGNVKDETIMPTIPWSQKA